MYISNSFVTDIFELYVYKKKTMFLFRYRTLPKVVLSSCAIKVSECLKPNNSVMVRSVITKAPTSEIISEESYVKKFMKKVGWMDHSQTRLRLSGYFLYESIPDKVLYKEWFQKCELPDTFTSWFIITELHVWMLMVRCMAEDVSMATSEAKYVKGDGHFIRNSIVEALWADVGNRIKLLEGANPTIAKKQASELAGQFQAALVGYDEGLNDDRVLAACIWRRFYGMSPDTNVSHVESIVNLIRHQIFILDRTSLEELWKKSKISWIRISDHMVM